MAAAIAMSDTCPVHPHSPREVCKSFASPWDNIRGGCMDTESVAVSLGTSGRAKTQSRTSSKKADNDK